jgi:hypothetical protein
MFVVQGFSTKVLRKLLSKVTVGWPKGLGATWPTKNSIRAGRTLPKAVPGESRQEEPPQKESPQDESPKANHPKREKGELKAPEDIAYTRSVLGNGLPGTRVFLAHCDLIRPSREDALMGRDQSDRPHECLEPFQVHVCHQGRLILSAPNNCGVQNEVQPCSRVYSWAATKANSVPNKST